MTESSMTALVEHGPNQLKLESVPIPSAAANEVVIEVDNLMQDWISRYGSEIKGVIARTTIWVSERSEL
jgi:hypothetical protein